MHVKRIQMFNIIFKQNKDLSKNSKKVKQWQSEHRIMANYALKVVEHYEQNNLKKAKKELLKLQKISLHHLMDEDVTFFELIGKAKDTQKDQAVVKAMAEFSKSFRDVKKAIFNFFDHYITFENPLDTDFKETLDVIINALVQRIEFEETNLYALIDN